MGEFQLEVLLRKPGWETQLCLGRAELAAGEQGCFAYIISPNLAMCNVPKGPDNYIFRLCFSSHFFLRGRYRQAEKSFSSDLERKSISHRRPRALHRFVTKAMKKSRISGAEICFSLFRNTWRRLV